MANSSLIKSLENIMRIDDGVDGDSQYIGQITWMLFLKAFDAKEMEWEFKPDYKGVIPVGYRWRDWADNKEGITGDTLIKFVGELFETLRKLDVSDGDMRKYVVRNVFEDINNYMKSGVQLRKLINAINDKVDFNDARERHTFNELYEEMLRDLQSAGQAGEYYTPRPVTNFIVEKVDPKLGELVLDPACGTGGFLTSTIAHFGSITSTEELAMLQKSINGWEKKPLPFLLAMTNLILHDIEIPALRHQNSLSKPLSEYSAKDIERLAQADADEYIRMGDDEVAEELNRLSELGVANMTAREKAAFKVLEKHMRDADISRELSEIGVTEDVYNSDEFKEFKKDFNPNTPIKKIYDLYTKTQPKKDIKPMGSMKTTVSKDNGIKDYYSPEEARQFTKKELDENPALFNAVVKSMSRWKK